LDFDDGLIDIKRLNSIDKLVYNKNKNVNNDINMNENANNNIKRCENKINNFPCNKIIENVQIKINNLLIPENKQTNSNYNKNNISKQKPSSKLKALGYKKNAEKFSQNIDASLMKGKPPKLPEIFFHDFTFNEQLMVKSNETFGKLNQGTIPVAFYNHLMISEENKKLIYKKSKYFRTSATQRNNKKVLTIIYYSP
jgi:hypothetical protein